MQLLLICLYIVSLRALCLQLIIHSLFLFTADVSRNFVSHSDIFHNFVERHMRQFCWLWQLFSRTRKRSESILSALSPCFLSKILHCVVDTLVENSRVVIKSVIRTLWLVVSVVNIGVVNINVVNIRVVSKKVVYRNVVSISLISIIFSPSQTCIVEITSYFYFKYDLDSSTVSQVRPDWGSNP